MRVSNPFSKKNKNAAAPTSDTTTPVAVDAAQVLGQQLADKLAAVVDNTATLPALLGATASAVSPADVEEETVTLASIELDNTTSAARYQRLMGLAHDEFVAALLPALKEGVAILVMCSTLDGNLVYPLSRIQDVPKFGRAPVGNIRETMGPDGEIVRLDEMSHTVEENGLTYNHMDYHFNLINHTPLRDRVKERLTALMSELLKWDNPMVARTVNVISAVITDGLDTSSTTTPAELNDLVGEIEGSGSLTEVATMIADLKNPRFREMLIRNIIGNLVPLKELERTSRGLWAAEFGARVLPEGHAEMDNETLLRWWMYEQGLAATQDRLWLPGTDPKAIRRAVGQMSQTAFQASTSAFREEVAAE